MARLVDRRKFMKTSVMTCAGCLGAATLGLSQDNGVPTDPKKQTYCGWHCGMHCKMYKATKENDEALKKESYEAWKWKEKTGKEFDADMVFCYGCKVHDKPLNLLLQQCTVRSCAMEKRFESCVQCPDLKTCDMILWKRFADHHKGVIKMREKYLEDQKG